MNDDLSLDGILERDGRISPAQLERARAISAETGQRLGLVITQLGLLSERALANLYGKILEVEPVTEAEYSSKLAGARAA